MAHPKNQDEVLNKLLDMQAALRAENARLRAAIEEALHLRPQQPELEAALDATLLL